MKYPDGIGLQADCNTRTTVWMLSNESIALIHHI